jgi:hypothetical protein
LLDRAQIGAHGERIIDAEFELRHVGMAGGYASLEPAGQLIEIKAAAKRAKWRRAGVRASSRSTDRVAARTEFNDQCATVAGRVLRLRG